MIENQEGKKIEPIGERLKMLMRHYHLNMNSLSIKLGLASNSVITRVVNDPERGMSLDYIQKVLSEFEEISAEWFVMNRGEMLKNRQLDNIKPSTEPCEHCKEREQKIEHLNELIALKNEIISAKEELLSEKRGDRDLGKQAAAG